MTEGNPDVRLMMGDCLERMSEVADQSVDLVLCDLPYGTTACAWDSVIPFEPLWAHYWRVCRGAVVLFGAEPFSSRLRISDLNFKYDWYWNKNMLTGVALAKIQPMRCIEILSVFYTKQPIYNPILTPSLITDRKIVEGRKNGSGSHGGSHNPSLQPKTQTQKEMVNPRNLLDIKCVPNTGGVKQHPTQKPVALMEYMVRTYTNPGALVLDNCMGSGTTGVACMNTGRRFIGIERDAGYFAIAEKRIKETDGYQLLYGG